MVPSILTLRTRTQESTHRIDRYELIRDFPIFISPGAVQSDQEPIVVLRNCYRNLTWTVNGSASLRWLFGPNSAWGGIESTTILTTHLSLQGLTGSDGRISELI